MNRIRAIMQAGFATVALIGGVVVLGLAVRLFCIVSGVC